MEHLKLRPITLFLSLRGVLIIALLHGLAVFFGPHYELRAQDTAVAMESDYQSAIRPLLKRYCYECHANDTSEADIDLALFQTTADVRQQTNVWQKVRQMLDSGQMPPKNADQPTDAERTQLQNWVRRVLASEAKARAGDPGPLVLRRLNNAEYTYTIRDLTGIESLDPTREFPIDGAAGEGFTNVGSGQGMSPGLVQKYMDAAKHVANHLVLLPDGVRFSANTTRRDQTDELLAKIQAFYRQFTEDGGGALIDLQGIKFNTNQGGLLPLEKYLAATIAARDELNNGRTAIDNIAREHGLNARYLATLWKALTRDSIDRPSFLMDPLREKWRRAKPPDAASLAADIARAQKALWKFNPVGHIGRQGGPTSWMQAVTPITTLQQFRFKLPDAAIGSDIVIYLNSSDLGDGNEQDFVVWQRPRIEFKADETGVARPPILLRDVRALAAHIKLTIASEFARTRQYIEAIAKLRSSSKSIDELAQALELNPRLLRNWNNLAGFGNRSERKITGRFTERLTRMANYEAINGWGSSLTPSLLTNRSDQPISFLTLTVPPRGVTVHPSPTVESVVSWQSPLNTSVAIEGFVADADNQCGNGAGWRLEVISESGKTVLQKGLIDNGRQQRFNTDKALAVEVGDIVSLVVNARENDHSCDTTHIDLKLSEVGGQQRVWNLASDIVDDVLNSNPLPDSYGNEHTWHFCATPSKALTASAIPPASVLARWRTAITQSKTTAEIEALTLEIENVLAAENATSLNEADKQLRAVLLDWKGPLGWMDVVEETQIALNIGYGLDPAMFGKHPSGLHVDKVDLCLQAPHEVQIRLPAELAAGAEFVTTGVLDAVSGGEGSAQLQVTTVKLKPNTISAALPVLVRPGSLSRARVEAVISEFQELFPPALCYARLVPVDEVVTLTLFHREDEKLKRLMLDKRQTAELDRLWDELYFVSQEPLKLVVAFEQISEFATQDRPDLVKSLAPMEQPIKQRADAFRKKLLQAEPLHVDAVIEFADRAWRRPLSAAEKKNLRNLYERLRGRGLLHEQAIHLTLARVLMSPAFLYKLEQPARGKSAAPVSDLELASRLSYFLWSSTPDDELRSVALAGRLTSESGLIAQTRRLLHHDRIRRLAIHFACQWLHLRDFDKNDDKNEKLYPEFVERRGDMYEETVQFFEDMFRNDRSILGLLDANYTFLNESLATHYGIAGVKGEQWRLVEGVRDEGRGGVLGMGSFLASQSGASRTSPILRGNWVYETLLGERLPRPPADVPQLPDEVPSGLTARQVIEHHSSVAACAICHVKIDPFGFALEQYDAIGRIRPQAVNTKTRLVDGTELEGINGLRDYLATKRRQDVVRQFCRKLLGYSLGREIQLSDEPLLDKMVTELAENGYRSSVAVEMVVLSRQFREIRGRNETDN